MTKTVIRRRKVEMPGALRKKLTGALAMLIIAAIMMVSSTFAWFTLSTAPEVKGLSTSIGSNGNLEMMLLDASSFASSAADLGKVSAVGDSIYTAADGFLTGNVTWGNLVDLGHTEYGLQNILLLPAALNVDAEDAITIGESIIYGASYGTDGRVEEVQTPTTGAPYNASTGLFEVADGYAGVRALGVAEEASAIGSAFARAKRAESTATNAARVALENSLKASTSPIYALLGLAGTDTGISEQNFANLRTTFDTLKDINANVFSAIKAATLMQAFSALEEDDQVTAIEGAVNALEAEDYENAEALISALETASGIGTGNLNANIESAIGQYYSAETDIALGIAAHTALSGHTATVTIGEDTDATGYADNEALRGVLNYLLNRNNIVVGDTINPNSGDIPHLTTYAEDNDNLVPVILYPGSGIYSYISKNVGTINTGNLKLSGTSFFMFDIPISTAFDKTVSGDELVGSGDTTIYLTYVQTLFNISDDLSTVSSFETGLGYALDFGFRTNAATGSKLLLETDATQRIYNEEDNESENADTLGQGTYLEFASELLSEAKLQALMGAIRVVFAEPTFEAGSLAGYTILQVAAADIESGEAIENGWKAPLALYNYTVAPVTVLDEESGEQVAVEGEAPILTKGDKKDSLEITTLTQNVGKKISVFVYLDGDVVDNTMVANATASMTGKLNLQFATDAELKPMEDATLRNGTPAAVTYTAVGNSVTIDETTYTVNDGYTVYRGSDNKYYYTTTAAPDTYVEITTTNINTVLTEA